MKFIKGDTIEVTVGKDKGRQSKIEKIDVKNSQLYMSGINQFKKHRKAQNDQTPGEILTLSRPLRANNVALICPKCKQKTRIGYKVTSGQKTRICRKCNSQI